MRIGLDQAARVMRGSVTNHPGGVQTTGAAIDSRAVAEGDLFFALRGEFFDGHTFADDAIGRGAAAVVVEHHLEDLDAPQILVEDPAEALALLGGWWRDDVDPVVVGITGSTGKTSTKDLLHAVAAVEFRTIASERNYNNELGVPLTLLRILRETEVAVTELGARGKGHIARLCDLARPSVGVVTNVGVTHFEQFGSRAAIAEAKSELVQSLPEGGTAVLNADDPEVARMEQFTAAEVLTYGVDSPAWLTASGIKLDPLGRPSFRMSRGGDSAWVELGMSGRHQVWNALAGAAAGLALGMGLEECAVGLGRAKGSEWRMQVEELGGVMLVNDAYNANPTSVASAIRTCADMARGSGRLIAVLGHMAELGELAEEEHRRAGALAASLVSRLIVVGKAAAPIAEGATAAGMADVRAVGSPADALAGLGDLRPGDVVLVKGSRSARLEGMLDELRGSVLPA